MANIFQKMFLPQSKLAKINQHQEILQLVSCGPVSHHAKLKLNGGVVRHFYVLGTDCNIHAMRTYEPSLPEDHQVRYSVIYTIKQPTRVKYATNSDVDAFAKYVYKKMFKAWEKTKCNAK